MKGRSPGCPAHRRLPATIAVLASLAIADRAQAAAASWCSTPPDPAAAAAVVQGLEPWRDPPPPPAAVHTEHTFQSDPARVAGVEAEGELRRLRAAALAWRNGADELWRARAAAGLQAWVATYRPDLNPIDETNLDALVDLYALLAPTLPPADARTDRTFLLAWGRGYVEASDAAKAGAHPAAVWTNNWQSHRVKLVTLIAAATGDGELQGQALRLLHQQVAENIRPSGEVVDFRQRDALHYVVYDLQPLLEAARAAQLFSPDDEYARRSGGASLAAAVAWLEPYADGHLSHQEFVHSSVRFDGERAAAGERGYAGLFDPFQAAALYHWAALFEPRYAALANRLGRPPQELALCGR